MGRGPPKCNLLSYLSPRVVSACGAAHQVHLHYYYIVAMITDTMTVAKYVESACKFPEGPPIELAGSATSLTLRDGQAERERERETRALHNPLKNNREGAEVSQACFQAI